MNNVVVTSKLVVKGFVQGVGYRAYVKQSGFRLKIKGTVKNLPEGDVEIFCLAPDNETFDRFKKMLASGVGEVEEIEEHLLGTPEYGQGPEEWIGFRILRDDTTDIMESLEYVILGGVQLRSDVHDLGRKQDKMFEKQDQTLKAIQTMDDRMGKKQDQTLEAIQTMDDRMGTRFDWLGDRYGEFGLKMAHLEGDIHEIKNASIKLVNHVTGEAK